MLRYPSEVQSGDFITLTPHEYRSNAAGGNGPPVGPPIVLYMPNSTPSMQNSQKWESKAFQGPAGEIKRDIVGGIVAGASDGMDGSGGFGVKRGISALKQSLGRMPDAARQVIIEQSAKMVGATGNQMMAYSRGQIFNPNIELLYDGPNMRSFGLNFAFIPKDENEALTVANIINNLKIWSSPEEQGQKYKIPAVWSVKYGGAGGTWMNRFKRSAITNIGVQYNAGLDMHATFSNGFPIRTDIQLAFSEVEVITRKDHRQNPFGGGF